MEIESVSDGLHRIMENAILILPAGRRFRRERIFAGRRVRGKTEPVRNCGPKSGRDDYSGMGGRALIGTVIRSLLRTPVSEGLFFADYFSGGTGNMKTWKKWTAVLMAALLMGGMMAGSTAAYAEETTAAEETAAAEKTVDLTILKEADDSMKNTYSLLAVNPEAPFTDESGAEVTDVAINTAGADALIEWLLSAEGMSLATEYGKETYGDTLFYALDEAPVYEGEIAPATEETKVIRLSTTTSVNDSGLLGTILPVFEEKYGYTVEIQSAGTGKAIAAAEYGNADLILVHAKAKEEECVEKGYARVLEGFEAERLSFLYNYFVLCGPSEDPAKVAEAETAKDAFAAIAEGKFPFVSRGDGSGTHTKELSLWPEELGITEDAASFEGLTDWYISANAGMGASLVMAEEMHAYILTDKATFLTFVVNNGVME